MGFHGGNTHVKKICMPVASVQDKIFLAKSKTPPEKISDFKSSSPSIYKRLHFLLYNIVYNVAALRITFPATIRLCDTRSMRRYAIAKPNKRHGFKGAVNTESSQRHEQAAKLKMLQQLKEKQAERFAKQAEVKG